jgi:hypothetical protein
MNNICQFARRHLLSTSKRCMSYVGNLNSPSGTIRYGAVNIMDYSGKNYIIPYTCIKYSDEIDYFVSNYVKDIPAEDYHNILPIIECMVNNTLIRLYRVPHHVRLMPPAKSMIPPCWSLIS